MEDDIAFFLHGLEELVGQAHAVELNEHLPSCKLILGVPLAQLAVYLEDVYCPACGIDALKEGLQVGGPIPPCESGCSLEYFGAGWCGQSAIGIEVMDANHSLLEPADKTRQDSVSL